MAMLSGDFLRSQNIPEIILNVVRNAHILRTMGSKFAIQPTPPAAGGRDQMQASIKGKTAGGILKSAEVVQMRAGTWEVVVSHPHQCIAMVGERADGWGGTTADVLVLTDASGLVARLKMSGMALAKMQRLAATCEAKYA